MLSNEAYQKYLIELQANGTTDNIQSNRGRFVVNFNRAQLKVIEWLIERNNEDDNRYLQKIKKIDTSLTKSKTSKNKEYFNLKEDYFDFIDINAYGSKNKCKNQLFDVEEVKADNLNVLLTDEFSKPSFKYRESFYLIGEGDIILFKDDFTFDTVLLSYYRYPRQLELESPDNPESQLKETELEFDDKLSNRIITLASAIHSLNANDQKYQALKQEVYSKI